MTHQAMLILMEWASLVSKEVQKEFAEYYEQKKEGYLFDETLGAHFSTVPNVFTSDMMKVMITRFEESKK